MSIYLPKCDTVLLLSSTFLTYCLSFICLGILEVLYCVLIESPEVLNIIQENHIKSIISLLDKHGRNHKVGVFFSWLQINLLQQAWISCMELFRFCRFGNGLPISH